MKTPLTTFHHELLANGTPADPYHPFYNDIFKSDVAEAAEAGSATEAPEPAAPSVPLLKIPFAEVSYSERLTWSPDQIGRWARDMAVACAKAQKPLSDAVFGITMTGDTPEEAYLRASDPSSWRRKGAKLVRIGQEMLELKNGDIGGNSDYQYSGPSAQKWSNHKRKANAAYLKHTVVCDSNGTGQTVLGKVAKTPEMAAARSYALLKAMQTLATEEGLRWAMLTITLPPEWHANPQNKAKPQPKVQCTAGRAPAEGKTAAPETPPAKKAAKWGLRCSGTENRVKWSI